MGTVSYSVQMPLSKIEELLFSAAGNSAQLLTNFRFAEGRINLLLEPVSADQGAPGKVMQATFANAVILMGACPTLAVAEGVVARTQVKPDVSEWFRRSCCLSFTDCYGVVESLDQLQAEITVIYIFSI